MDKNFKCALYRLRHEVESLHKRKQHDTYNNEILQLERNGFTERKTCYMPHRGVWMDNLTTKLQVVFDASSQAEMKDPQNARLTKVFDLNASVY